MREDKIVSLQNLGIICKNRVRNIQEYRLPNQALQIWLEMEQIHQTF